MNPTLVIAPASVPSSFTVIVPWWLNCLNKQKKENKQKRNWGSCKYSNDMLTAFPLFMFCTWLPCDALAGNSYVAAILWVWFVNKPVPDWPQCFQCLWRLIKHVPHYMNSQGHAEKPISLCPPRKIRKSIILTYCELFLLCCHVFRWYSLIRKEMKIGVNTLSMVTFSSDIPE